jgi:hypothetical protein
MDHARLEGHTGIGRNLASLRKSGEKHDPGKIEAGDPPPAEIINPQETSRSALPAEPHMLGPNASLKTPFS